MIEGLGALPPAGSLSSVHLAPPSRQPARVSWENTTPNVDTTLSAGRSSGLGLHIQPQLPATHAGLTLSPAAETFPKKLVDKVRSRQFVEMKELLADNVALISQLEAVSGLSASHMLGTARPRLREVTALPTWCYCFLGYMAIQTSDPATRDQLAYARQLIKESQRHGGLGWLDYDRAFRQQVAADPAIRWNTLIPGLQASTILGPQRAGPGLFCTLCRQVDHTRAQCALACLEPAPTVAPYNPVAAARRGRKKYCIAWNKGACPFPEGECQYVHECPKCKVVDHRAKDCAEVPESSPYKTRSAFRRQPGVTPT